MAAPADGRRHWLRALAAADGLAAAQTRHPLDHETAHWLARQGLAPYTYYLLRRQGLLDHLSASVQQGLSRAYYSGALNEAIQHEEALTSVLAALRTAGIPHAVLKGLALAHSVYPNPRCRPKGDLDIWIPPETLEEATAALASVGYRPEEKDDRPLSFIQRYDGEQQFYGEGRGQGLIELQWPAIRGQWIRQVATVDNEAIWQRRRPQEIEGESVEVLSPEDTLLHLIVHLGINHAFTFPWLRALLDIHLAVIELAPDLTIVEHRAHEWRLRSVTWTMLGLCRDLFDTPIPDDTLHALRPSAPRRTLIRRLELDRSLLERWEIDFHHRRFLVQLAMIDRPADSFRLIWRALFPEQEWIEARYGVRGAAVWRERLLHPWRLVVTARA